ncbi:MAG: MaoC/PaaZ C-terminal domain-containing protein [Proteobacteria bacterium]|nr:MaoC/PaaZ C-terminal domain-containing protein [Pseudomonadota bacterium]
MTQEMIAIPGDLTGRRIPTLRFKLDLKALVKYAAATWDFHRYHYDAEYAARAGMEQPFVDGQMFGALMARSLMTWAGPDAFLCRLRYRQEEMVFVDETIVITGVIRKTEMQDEFRLVSAEFDVTKEDGSSVIRAALAKVQLPHADKNDEAANT